MNAHSKYKEHCQEKKKAEEVSEKEEKLNGLLAELKPSKDKELNFQRLLLHWKKKLTSALIRQRNTVMILKRCVLKLLRLVAFVKLLGRNESRINYMIRRWKI